METELKFQIPATRRAAVLRAVGTSSARTVRMRALYFDTPDKRLAAAGVALRLRQEDGLWVQTLKGRGDGYLNRLEHEVPLGKLRSPPALDIARHAGTPSGDILNAALGGSTDLQVLFETDVKRTQRIARLNGSRVELALDLGEIRAGAARLTVCELEFELKGGTLDGMLDMATRWVQRHDLWLDVRSKAERGGRLARGESAGPPVRAAATRLKPDLPADTALRQIVDECVQHVLPNVAELVGGVGGPEHLHQARVALRRLRSALRLFGDWSHAVDPAWEPALATLFADLGAARDDDVLRTGLWPELLAAGAPSIRLPISALGSPAAEMLCTAEFNTLMLALIGCAQGSPSSEVPTEAIGSVGELGPPRLKRLQRQLAKEALRFGAHDDDARHRLRKRLKRLRYGLEFMASLYQAKAHRQALARLAQAQEALGRYNDLAVAEARLREHAQTEAPAWFAVGWLAAARQGQLQKATRALKRWAKQA